jgi:hypothetical protein
LYCGIVGRDIVVLYITILLQYYYNMPSISNTWNL